MRQKITTEITAAAASTAISTLEAGFLPGVDVIADIFAPLGAFAGTARWQTSPDNVTWSNVGVDVVLTTGGFNTQTIRLAQWVRLNVSAFTSGRVGGRLLSDID